MTAAELAEYERQAKEESADWQAKDILKLVAAVRDAQEERRRAQVDAMDWAARTRAERQYREAAEAKLKKA